MSIFGRLCGRRASTAIDAGMSPQQATEIIQRYGAALEHAAPAPGCVADASKLPFPKSQIKQALLIGLRSAADPRMREMLKVGYLHLVDWQDGVGRDDQGFDVSRMDFEEDSLKRAERVLSQSEGHEKWISTMQAEEGKLRAELEQEAL